MCDARERELAAHFARSSLHDEGDATAAAASDAGGAPPPQRPRRRRLRLAEFAPHERDALAALHTQLHARIARVVAVDGRRRLAEDDALREVIVVCVRGE